MARPPPDRTGEPDLIEFGIPVLDDRLPGAKIEFPATSGDLEAAMGAIEIPYDAHGHTVTLGDALDQVEQEEFESKGELLEALHPVFEAHRRWTSSGLLGAVRSVLPF